MRLLKQALAVLGAFVLFAVIVAFVAPKRTPAVAAAFVQIVPGTTTQVGQNESQLVSLDCLTGNAYCIAVDSQGNGSTSAYVVPTGKTLIVTDYQFTTSGGVSGALSFDSLENISTTNTLASGTALADKNGFVYAHEHFQTGIPIGSGVTIADVATSFGKGFASVQG